VERAFIGVTTTKITKQLSQDLNLPVDEGAMIVRVTKGSPADDAGLRAGNTQTQDGLTIGGDLIVEVSGKKIKSPDDVLNAIQDKKPGDSVPISYYRGGKKKSVSIKLGKRPSTASSQSPDQGGGGILPLP
jgi:2-alkenal reductase